MSSLLVGDVPSEISTQLVSLCAIFVVKSIKFRIHSLLDGNGDWNTDGCTITTFNESTNVVGCQCNHLTNFACLVVSMHSVHIFVYRIQMFYY